MEESSEQSIVEEREELMVSPTGGNPTRRKAYFLKPSVNGTMADILSPSLSFPTSDPQNRPWKLSFKGWRHPGKNWAKWVNLLLPQYQSVWKEAGIYDAILSTTHEIRRDDDLFLGIVERWCADTKSFVFVWGEATITLEDVMVLGGFSVVGKPVYLPLVATELKEVEERLVVAKKEVVKARPNKACQHFWVKKFMGSGSDIEHEAFLVYWLCRFVFSEPWDLIKSCVFPIAIHLARGTRIALAPAVLAAIYRDLTVSRQTIVDSVEVGDDDDVLALTILSPFHLVQLWLWERFPELQPVPNSLKEGDTRSARWDKVKGLGIKNVRSVMDSAGESFVWRPYTNVLLNWEFKKFYKEHQGWVHADEELLPFTCCIRISQLVGRGFIEQYLPHRVAMQFGMDQDLPVYVPQPDEAQRVAWSHYSKPIATKLYIPPRLFESDVTVRYFEWWKKFVVSGQVDVTESVLQEPRSSKRLKKPIHDSEEKRRTIDPKIWTDRPKVSETPISSNGHDSLCNKAAGDGEKSSGQCQGLETQLLKEQLLQQDGAMTYVKKPTSKRRASTSKQESSKLRSNNKKGNGAKPSSCFESESPSSSTTSHGRVRYKSLEEIARCEASMQVMKGADETMKKPKLEPEDEVGEIDKVIAQLKAEFSNILVNQFEKPSLNELEDIIAELKQEFGIGIPYST